MIPADPSDLDVLRQISIGSAPAENQRSWRMVASGALLIETYEVSRWRSARQGAPYGFSIIVEDERNRG